MLNRIYTLVLSAALLGLFRAIGTLVLDRHWATGLDRLAAEAVESALIGPDFLLRAALAALVALIAAALAERLLTPWIEREERREAAVSALMVISFWVVAAVAETADRTVIRDVMNAEMRLGVAQLEILAIALFGACVSFATWCGLNALRTPKSSLATVVVLLSWTVLASAARVKVAHYVTAEDNTRPNVLLITIDTLRADHLSTYGYARRTTPRIDALATRGTVFTNAIAQAPNTHPSTAALMSSRYPSDLGNNPYKYIPYEAATIAESFRNAGYATAAVVSNVWLKSSLGFDAGFDHFDETSAISEFYADGHRIEWKNAADVTNAALAWLAQRPERPFLLWLHYLDPHHPYNPPAAYRTLFSESATTESTFLARLDAMTTGQQTRALSQMGSGEIPVSDQEFRAIVDQYDREIAYTDFEIGRVLDRLDELGLGDETAIAVTADHGEEFRDHDDWGHSHTLHRELLHVPLVIAFPSGPASRVDTPVRLLDVGPTLLAGAGIAKPVGMRGTDLFADNHEELAAISMLTRKDEASVQWKGWKVITDLKTGATQLFDVSRDAGEHIDLAAAEPQRVADLRAILAHETGSGARTERMDATANQLDASTRKQLEALGYID